MENEFGIMMPLMIAGLLPYFIASGTCFIKFSIAFIMVRNALGLQQIPSNLMLNGIALLLSTFVMLPIGQSIYEALQGRPLSQHKSIESFVEFIEEGITPYRQYLQKHADPELTAFFAKSQTLKQQYDSETIIIDEESAKNISIFALLPAYALTEIKEAFKIGFYLYLPFVVVDLLVSSVLLSLGMMMMSPVTISTPIKLILFVVLDGWTLLSQGLIKQYLDFVT